VRVGSAMEPPEKVAERREALDLAPAAPAPAPEMSSGQTWIGGGAVGGKINYQVGDSCSGDYTLYDRRGGGGWVQVDRQLPSTPTSVFWVGGRGGLLIESRDITQGTSSGITSQGKFNLQSYFGQVFGEWEHPNFAVGLGLMGIAEWSQRQGLGSGSTQRLYPAFHLRAGASFLSLDGGLYDRQGYLGMLGYRVGVSGAMGAHGRIRHPNDTLVRYFLGAITFPTTDLDGHLARAMLGTGLDVYLSRRLVLGSGAAIGDGIIGSFNLRSRVGD